MKPYSTDVLVALALLWAAGRVLDSRPAARWTLAAAGVVGVWLSMPAIFVAAGVGLTLTLSAWRRGDRPKAALFASVAAAWGASFLAHYLVASGLGWILDTPDRERRLVGGVMASFLLASLAAYAVDRPAYRIRLQEVRPLVAMIARQGRPGDLVVLNARVRPIFGYYSRRLSAADGFVRGLPVVELPGTNRWRVYETRLRALAPGARVWLLYAHHPSWRSEQDEAFALHVLDRHGQRRAEARAPGASLHLYELAGDAALRSEPGT